MKKYFICIFAFIIMIGLFPFLASANAPNVYDNLRLKYRNTLLGGTLDATDPIVASKLAVIDDDTEKYWASQNVDGVWDEYEQFVDSNSAYTAYSLRRLKNMAISWSLPESQYYQNSILLADILKGMDYLYTDQYNENTVRYGNWWWWEIGTPFELNDLVVLLYDELTSTQSANYMKAVKKFVPNPVRTGANLTDSIKIVAVSGVISKDSVRIQAASDALSQVFPYVTALDGFYADGSFVQHFYFPYAGAYGDALLASISVSMNLLAGSQWENTDPLKTNVFNWVFDTFENALNKGTIMQAFMGRGHSRSANSTNILAAISNISQMSGNPYASEMQGLVKYHIQNSDETMIYEALSLANYTQIKQIMDDTTISPRPAPAGNRQFYNQDVAVHHGNDWTLVVRNHSTRMATYESFGGVNLEPWYQADGVTYLYNDSLDFTDNYLTTVDNHRLPGITVDIDRSRPSAGSDGFRSEQDMTGGVELDRLFGVTLMDFKQHNYSNMDLEAKKSWFMFDDEVVALGSGITSTSGRTIETIVENRALDSGGLNPLTVDGITKPASSGWQETIASTDWVHLAGTGGFYFPKGDSIKMLREQRAREAREINANGLPRSSEFDSASLPSAWQWTREDSSHWKLENSALVLTAQQGSLAGAANSTKNILTFEVPRGDYTMSTKLTFDPVADGQEAGIIMYLDDDNYIYLSRAGTASGTELRAVNEVMGSATVHSSLDSFNSTMYLKLDKDGDQYSLYASSDGVNWGTVIHAFTREFERQLGQKLTMGVFAHSGTGTLEAEAAFDWIETLVTNHYVTIWKDHGEDPSDQMYSYVMLPNMSSTEVESYSVNPDIEIVEQSKQIHAVRERSLGLLGAVFWEQAGGMIDYLSSRQQSAVMVKDTGTEMQLAVSDPSQKQAKVVIELNRSGTGVISQDPEVTVVQLQPTIILEVNTASTPGKSFEISLAYDANTTALPSNAPVGLTGNYNGVDESHRLSWNAIDSAISYNVYRSTTSGSGYVQLASGITSPSYTDAAIGHAPYYYKVTAVSTYGESSYSDEIRVENESNIRLLPAADTFVRDGAEEGINYGSDRELIIKKSNSVGFTRETFMKFDLNGIDADQIISATLYAYGRAIDGTSVQVHAHGVEDDSWDENSLTWLNKPTLSPIQSTLVIDSLADRWRAFDVTSHVKSQYAGDGMVSLAFSSAAGAGANFESREGGVRPYLELKVREDRALTPMADAYVRNGAYSEQNFGFKDELVIKKSNSTGFARESFLKFNLDSIMGEEVASAKLYVYGRVVDGVDLTSDVEAYGVDDDSWTEHGITWSNKPLLTALQSTATIDSTNEWREFDVTEYLQSQLDGDRVATIALKDIGGFGSIFTSKEGNFQPYLDVKMSTLVSTTADAYVRDGTYADVNYGSDRQLVTKKGNVGFSRRAYLKFDLSHLEGKTVSSVKLLLYGKAEATHLVANVEAYGVEDDTWTESGITWNNKPAFTSFQSAISINGTDEWREFDITAFVQNQLAGDMIVSIGLLDVSANGSIFSSKEGINNSYQPYLSIVLE